MQVGYAQKTLKELVAEEKAAKEAEKKAKAEEKARQEAEKKAREEAKAKRDAAIAAGEAVPEDVASYVTLTDSALWAPTNVKQLGAQNYGELTKPVSSLDLNDPENITTSVEYQPETGTYVIRTRMGDTDITTPYLLTQEEYNQYAERQIMHKYWQQKIGEVEHNNESKFDITDMKLLYARAITTSSISTRRSKPAYKVKWVKNSTSTSHITPKLRSLLTSRTSNSTTRAKRTISFSLSKPET